MPPEEQKVPHRWHWQILLAVGLAIFITGAATAYFYFFPGQKTLPSFSSYAYTIPNVPYVGLHYHTGEASNITSNTAAVAASILEYWEPGEFRFEDVQKDLPSAFVLFTTTIFSDLAAYFQKQPDFAVNFETIPLRSLSQYLNTEKRTPLVLLLPLAPSQPKNIVSFPITVLIGIDEGRQMLTFQDYWYGPLYEVSFANFNAMQELFPEGRQNRYLVVRPKNPAIEENVRMRTVTPYKPRGEYLQKIQPLITDFAIAAQAIFIGDRQNQLRYLTKLISDPLFETDFPPLLQVTAYARLSDALLSQGNTVEALAYAKKAIDRNHDLDKPFKGWAGYPIVGNTSGDQGRIGWPHRILGNALQKSGDRAGAIAAYKAGLSLDSRDSRTKA